MNDPLDPDDFATTLLHELAHASEQGARGLHVQVSVPADAAFQWIDGEAVPHQVHLPSGLKVAPLRFVGEPVEDGGPAAVFKIDAQGHVPSEDLVHQMADELYRECIRWGRIHHSNWEGDSDVEELPLLPSEFDDLVQTAIFLDVS